VELDAVEFSRRVLHDGDGAIHRGRRDPEPFWKFRDPIAMAHPDPLAGLETGKEKGGFTRLVEYELCGAVFPHGRGRDLSSQPVGHELYPVADPEDGHTQVKNPLPTHRYPLVENTRGTPRKDDAFHLFGFQ